MDTEFYAKKFIEQFPEQENRYQEYVAEDGTFISHFFFGESICPVLSRLLTEKRDTRLIKKYIDFIEDMYTNGDDAVKNIVEVTIMECLGDNETVLKNAFAYFPETLMQASKTAEAGIRRRNIHIRYKRGKVLAGW